MDRHCERVVKCDDCDTNVTTPLALDFMGGSVIDHHNRSGCNRKRNNGVTNVTSSTRATLCADQSLIAITGQTSEEM